MYKTLSWISTIFIPLAPAFFFGWRVYSEIDQLSAGNWMALPVSVASAVGLEVVGILAGHAAVEYQRRADHRWLLSAGIMAVYVAIGIYELRGTIGAVMFLIAPLVYVLAALQHYLDEIAEQETAVSEMELAEKQKNAELTRRLREERERAKIAAKYGTQTRQENGKIPARKRQDTGNLPADWRQLTQEQCYHLAHLPREERDEIMPKLADRTRRKWHERLDKIAAQNGHYLENK